MQYKKHPIDRALEALAPILAPSFTLRSFRDKEGTVLKYPLIDYAIAGTTSKVYDSAKNQWRSTYLVIFEILVQEKKVYDWCNYTELADAQDKHALFLAMEVIIQQFIVLLTNPSKVTNLIRPLDTIYSDLFFKQEGSVTTQYVSGHGKDLLTGVVANFEISCIDIEGGACCLIDFNNQDQLDRLRDLMQYGSVSWNLLNQAGGNPPVTACDLIRAQLNDELRNTCVLPQYDFSSTATQNALSAQQILDLKNWLLPQYDFGDSYWQNLLTAQQEIDLTFYLLPLVDFLDPLIQAIITTQQKNDILVWLFPLLDFTGSYARSLVTPQQEQDLRDWLLPSNCAEVLDFIEDYMIPCVIPSVDYSIDANFNALTNEQKDDLEDRFIPIVQQTSIDFDGTNESVVCGAAGVHNFTNTQAFTISLWVYPTNLTGAKSLISKRVNGATGWSIETSGTSIIVNLVNTVTTNQIQCSFASALTLNTWQHVVITVDGSSNANGVNCYINTVSKTRVNIINNLTLSCASAALMILGRNAQTGTAWFTGALGFSRIWSSVLSFSDIQFEYNLGKMNNVAANLPTLNFDWRSGLNANFAMGVGWIFPDVSGTYVISMPYSLNGEFTDRTTNVPV